MSGIHKQIEDFSINVIWRLNNLELGGIKRMRLKFFVLSALLLTIMGFSVIPVMAQINPPPQNGDPIELTQELRSVVNKADPQLLKGYAYTITKQIKKALSNKIDTVIAMFENGNFKAGYKKMDNDIAPKLWKCHTNREQARSWLSNDPTIRDQVEVFRDTCQQLILEIKLADPRPTP